MLEEIKVNDEYDILVTKQDHFGKGLVKVKNMFIFIKDALPEEVCKIEITNVKKTYANARIKKMIKASTNRTEPKCPYYNICGGCHIMHQKYQNQLQFKEQKVKELLEKFTGLKNVNLYPVVGKNQFYYRNKVVFHGEKGKLGFYQEKTNRLVPIKNCVITDKKLNKIYHSIQNFLSKHSNNILNHLMLRKTSLEETLVVLEGNIDLEELLPYLESVTTIYLNNKLVKGKKFIEEDIFGIRFKIYPSSFFQVNYEMMLILYRIVMNFYQDKEYDKVLDLYCGTGTIGMLVASFVEQVIGVERESSSIVSANLCKEVNHITNITFIEGKVEDKIDTFQEVDSIIVDPPRSGLDHHTLDTILELNPQTITYISCDPVTLARDLKILLEDYDVLEVHPVDMFPNTYHVENVVFLERKKKRTFKNYTILVNKSHPYKEIDFNGMSLVKTTNIEGKEIFVEEITYSHYLAFKDALKKLEIEVSIISGYRSLEEQKKEVDKLKDINLEEKDLYEKVAPVGCSEHHTGLALDIIISTKKEYQKRPIKYCAKENFQMKENKYQILAQICSDYGFILRYPKEKVAITGYAYDPCHFRYVGRKIAKVIMENHITLEEYLEK